MPGHLDSIRSIAFASNKVFASGSWDETVKLWRVDGSEELATIVKVNKENWIIYRPDGRFETGADLEGNETLHWAMRGDALNPLPLDIFMRDYSERNLFQRLLECAETNSCDDGRDAEFKQIRDLSELNIIQPKVTITGVSLPDADREVNVTVEVSSASGVIQREDRPKVSRTAKVYDLRVFRDRQQIGVAPADGAEKLQRHGTGQGNSEADLKVWREASEITLDPRTGKYTLSFKAKLPQGEDPAAIKFTAYAFNDDRVKSQTASYEWTAEQKAKLPKARPDVVRRAYVISVGVNSSHISDWNLNHGADDSHQFQKVIPEKLRQVGAYEIVPVELVSGLKDGNRVDDATKQNVKAVFDILAGRQVPAEVGRTIPNGQQLRKATPDDLVLIMFSSHGYSGKNGDLYLFPADIARADANQTIPDLQSLISGEEMSIWLRDVDADDIAIIIDACQSAAAVEGFDFKPGPLGSRGLGQLAYDKRMMILTATQADNGALEVDGEINQGLLSYALVQEGLVEGRADMISNPDVGKDGKITLEEWLEFGEMRVAHLYENVIAGNLRGVVWKRDGKLVRRGDPDSDPLPSIQRASLFNYSRRSNGIVVAYAKPESGDAK